MSESAWRRRAAPLIAAVLAAHPDPKEQRAALRAAYPFGPRCCWPYKAWLAEVRAQRRPPPPPEPPELELFP